MTDSFLNTYINNICDELEIKVPVISYDTSHFPTPTTLAMVKAGTGDRTGTLYIRKMDKPNPDFLFCIAHELRHLWQVRYHENFYMSDYKTSDVLGVEAYNLQPAEIDANAFGAVIMEDYFDIEMTFDCFSDKIFDAIQDRADEIVGLS